MTLIDAARDLLRPGETALALYTDGTRFRLDRDGGGVSGRWVVDPTRQPDRVIVYQVAGAREGLTADIFSAAFAGFEGPDDDGRCAVRLRAVVLAGLTDRGWQEFAGPGQNPVRHLARPGVPAPGD